jgi:hypothetical protein
MIQTLRDCEIQAGRIFGDNPFDDKFSPDRIRKSMAEILQGKADYLAKILSDLQEVRQQRLPKKCRHPKKGHDITVDGQKYCMNCNVDL